jgi:hypothetical protein
MLAPPPGFIILYCIIAVHIIKKNNMEPIKRTIKIIRPNELLDISKPYNKKGYSLIDHKELKIISIKIKGVDPSDLFMDVCITDSWNKPNFEHSKRWYLGKNESKFIEQLGYMVLYTDDMTISIPHRSTKIECRFTLFNQDIDINNMEVLLNIIADPSDISESM